MFNTVTGIGQFPEAWVSQEQGYPLDLDRKWRKKRGWLGVVLCLLVSCFGRAADNPQQPSTVSDSPARPDAEVVFPGLKELGAEAVVQQVLARNPTLAQMVAAWQAAAARYPQVISLEDPMFLYWMAPASINSPKVEDFGYRLEISQKFPWPGKRSQRGQNALAEASAARHEIEDTRLQLIESARLAFYDYFLVARALEVNQEGLRLLKEFRQNAENRYTKGLLNQQDILQAEVEIGRQQERQLALERMRQVAMARLNTLMHLPPQAAIPPPLAKLSPPEPVTDLVGFQARALSARPDLLALADRIAADRAALALAHKEFCPDVEAMAAYDTIMGNGQMRDLAPQVGLRMNLPLRQAKRYGALAEAEARLAQRQAELARQVDQVHFEVEQAFAQAAESDRTLRLYEEKILPAAALNIKAAQAAYIPGRIPFLSLVEAQRNLVMLRDRYYETLADAYRRRATLERVTGGPPRSTDGP